MQRLAFNPHWRTGHNSEVEAARYTIVLRGPILVKDFWEALVEDDGWRIVVSMCSRCVPAGV